MAITVRKIDREKWTIDGVDKDERSWSFLFRSSTKIRTLSPEDETVSLSLLLLQDPDDFPIEKGQKVLVHWRPDAERRVRLAVKFTLIETE